MIKRKLDNTSRVSEKELSQAEYDRLIDREDAHNYSKKEMSLDQLRRQWQLITLIPGYQRPKTIANLSSRIGDSDDPSFLRKIQRDIAQLKEVIGDDLLVERRGGAKGAPKDRRILEGGGQNVAKSDVSIKGARGAPLQVSWSKNGPPIKVSSLSQTEAIAFGVLKQIGVDWMPDTMQDALRPYFNEAFEEAAMQVESNKGISSIKSASMTKKWLNKVRYLPSRDIVFIPPKILPKVETNVLEALLNEFLLEIDYVNRNGEQSQGIIISPHALVRRGSRTYLFAKRRGGEGVHPYLMSRILSAKITIGQFELDRVFNLKERLKKGISRPDPQIPLEIYGQDINLKLWVNKETGYWMQETPLSQSQTATATKNQDGFLITAKVPMQEELIWWLRSMGPNIKVLGPQLVVNRIKADLKKVYGQYKRF